MDVKRGTLSLLLAAGLVLGVHKGYVALWESDSIQPCQIYPYKASLLPPAEQALLEEGIPVRDEDHLRSLLRDYLS